MMPMPYTHALYDTQDDVLFLIYLGYLIANSFHRNGMEVTHFRAVIDNDPID